MSQTSQAYEPRRFRSTVPFYATYRVPYPEPLIRHVAEQCALVPGSPLLDLGCGPGPLAVAFARLGCTVTAMDPEPDMLAAAGKHASASGVSIGLVEGSSFDLAARLGTRRAPFRLVAMGRSFHWMDRDETLRVLDGMIDPAGAVVLFGDRHVAAPGADWPALLRALSTELVPDRMARLRRNRPGWEPHEAVLLRSPFRHLTVHGMTVARQLSADDIVGRALSKSVTSPEALGERREEFEQRLRTGLQDLAGDGELSEIVELRALVARRSPGW